MGQKNVVHSVRSEHVLAAIAAGRLRVDLETGVIETRRPNPKAIWRVSKLEKVFSPHQKKPYFRCSFTTDGITYRCLVHRAVWFAAGRSIPEGQELNHKNGDKASNGLENLELMTSGGNKLHAFATGLNRLDSFHARSSQLTRDLIIEIRESPESGAAIARRLGQTPNTISRVRLRRTYRSV